jgi:hypothetical protein
MRLEFSAQLARKRLAFSIQVAESSADIAKRIVMFVVGCAAGALHLRPARVAFHRSLHPARNQVLLQPGCDPRQGALCAAATAAAAARPSGGALPAAGGLQMLSDLCVRAPAQLPRPRASQPLLPRASQPRATDPPAPRVYRGTWARVTVSRFGACQSKPFRALTSIFLITCRSGAAHQRHDAAQRLRLLLPGPALYQAH